MAAIDDSGRALATSTSYVIRCIGVAGAFGPARPAGWYLKSFDPDLYDQTLEFRGLSTWSPSIGDAWRFPGEAAAHECIEAGLTGRFKVRIVPIPAREPPPVITGKYAMLVYGQPLTEAERQEAQEIIDRLWLDGYL